MPLTLVLVLAAMACTSAKDDPKSGVSCKTDESSCACSIGVPGTAPCSASTIASALCCASTGWPNEGTCECSAVTCIDDGVQCRCARGLGGPLTTCSGAICCQAASGDCYCRRAAGGQLAKCDAADTPSAFCSPSAGTRCVGSSTKVDSCS